MLDDFEYHSPGTVAEACKLLKRFKDTAHVLAGGTDLIPQMHGGLKPEHVVNLKSIPGLNTISYNNKKGLTLGALVRFNDLIYSDLVQTNYPVLVEVSKKIASYQIRNLATVGGNLCNAAPSADSAPILIALDSRVALAGPNGKKRSLKLENFFTGPGMTALKPGEILTQITVPPIEPHTGLAYIKHTTRRALEIAVVGAVGLIRLDDNSDKCMSARVVIAACAPTPLRVPAAEKMLSGKTVTEADLKSAAAAAAVAVAPITDIRAGDVYRREMVRVQCARTLQSALARASSWTATEVK